MVLYPNRPTRLDATVLTSTGGAVDRRTLLTRAAALGLSGAALAGLATSVSAAPGAALPAAQEGSSLTFALNGDPTLNVFVWPNQLPSVLVAKNVFSCLLKYSADDGSTVVPDLATEWSVSEDGLVWTFTLREGVLWHDGQPFTADDVKFTLDGILNPDVRAQFRAALSGVTEVAVVDPQTVTITSSRRSARCRSSWPTTSRLPRNISSKGKTSTSWPISSRIRWGPAHTRSRRSSPATGSC